VGARLADFFGILSALQALVAPSRVRKNGRAQCGITVRQGFMPLRKALPDILSSKCDALSPRMISLIAELVADWRRLDERIAGVSTEIETPAKPDESCQRLMSVPGIGPIVSSAVVAAIGHGGGFKQGRDFAAWLGLIPKQESTGDRTILGKISKRGNKYVRTLFVQAAHVVLERRPSTARQVPRRCRARHRRLFGIARQPADACAVSRSNDSVGRQHYGPGAIDRRCCALRSYRHVAWVTRYKISRPS
jgi:transposase